MEQSSKSLALFLFVAREERREAAASLQSCAHLWRSPSLSAREASVCSKPTSQRISAILSLVRARTSCGSARAWTVALRICSPCPAVGSVSTGTPRHATSQMVSLPVEQMTPVHRWKSSTKSLRSLRCEVTLRVVRPRGGVSSSEGENVNLWPLRTKRVCMQQAFESARGGQR